MVEAFGWPTFFLMTVLAALPGLLVLRLLREAVHGIDDRQRLAL